MEWLISLASGAVGGNLGGALLKKLSLGPVLNSIVGIIGGGAGMQWLGPILNAGGGLLSQVGGGAIGGTALMAIIGVIKKVMGGGSQAAK